MMAIPTHKTLREVLLDPRELADAAERAVSVDSLPFVTCRARHVQYMDGLG